MIPPTIAPDIDRSGLIGFLEDTRVRLPLKAIDIEAQVTGELVSVELEQIYLQEHSEPLDCTFTFPLPADAAVYRCEMHIGDRVIEAKVRTRSEARQIHEEQTCAGRRSALAEMDRENLFNLRLGNLQPGDLLRVRLAYVQRLERVDELRSLRVPLTPGERYVPGRPLRRANQGTGTADDTDRVPDASRVTPPRIDALHPDAASFHARVAIDSPVEELGGLRSPSHRIKVDKEASRTLVRPDGEAIPDRDFVIEWSALAARETSARAWLTEHDGSSYGLLELHGGPAPSEGDTEQPDVYIVLDRSGSMGGAPWEAASRAVCEFAGRLPATTCTDLTLFESKVTPFSQQPLEAARFLESVGEGGSKLTALGVCGGTNLGDAIRAVMERRRRFSPGRPAVILLITDGMVADERLLLDAVRDGDTMLHLVGIGFAPNDALRSLAESTGGQAVFAAPDATLAGVVTRFASRLRAPLLVDLELPRGWTGASGSSLPSLYPGEQRVVAIRGPLGEEPGAVEVSVDGQRRSIGIGIRRGGHAALPRIWARDRIRHLERAGDSEQATELALRFNLASNETSFIAWDPAERVMVADQHLHQPALRVAEPLSLIEGSPRLRDEGAVYDVCRKASAIDLRMPDLMSLPASEDGADVDLRTRQLEERTSRRELRNERRRMPGFLRRLMNRLLRLLRCLLGRGAGR